MRYNKQQMRLNFPRPSSCAFSYAGDGRPCKPRLRGEMCAQSFGRGILADWRDVARLVVLACLHLAPCGSIESMRRGGVVCVGSLGKPFGGASFGSPHDPTFPRPTFPLRAALPLSLRGGDPGGSAASSGSVVEHEDEMPPSSEIDRMERELLDAEKQDELEHFEFTSSDSEAQEDQFAEFDTFLKSFPDKNQNTTAGLGTEHLLKTTGEDYIGTYFEENDDLEESQGETTVRRLAQIQREEQAQPGLDAEADEDASGEVVAAAGPLEDDEVFKMWERVIAEARQNRRRHNKDTDGKAPLLIGSSAAGRYSAFPHGHPLASESWNFDLHLDPEEDDVFDPEEIDQTVEGMGLAGLGGEELTEQLLAVAKDPDDRILLPVDHVRQVEALVRCGANVSGADRFGWTPLHHAAFKGHPRIVRKLVKLGAEMEAQNRDGNTPLLSAARYGRVHSCRMLLELGANFRHSARDGETVMDKTLRSENPALIDMIAELFSAADDELLAATLGQGTGGGGDEGATKGQAGRLKFDVGEREWLTLAKGSVSGPEDLRPQHDPRLRWRPMGWSYKDIDRQRRYEKDFPELAEVRRREEMMHRDDDHGSIWD